MNRVQHDDDIRKSLADDLASGQPLRIIAAIVDEWDTSIPLGSAALRKELIATVAAAITEAGGDGAYFERIYKKERHLELAVMMSCGNVFWHDAKTHYRDMLDGTSAPQDIYYTIESDLQLAGRTIRDRKQHPLNQYMIAPSGTEATQVRAALLANALEQIPLPEPTIALMRRHIEAVMEKQLQRAHEHMPHSQVHL